MFDRARDTEAVANLNDLSAAYARWAGLPSLRFASWDDAFQALIGQRPRPTPIVTDEIGRIIDRLPRAAIAHTELLITGPHHRTEQLDTPDLVRIGVRTRCAAFSTVEHRDTDAHRLTLSCDPLTTGPHRLLGALREPRRSVRHYAFPGSAPAYLGFASGARPRGGDVNSWVRQRLLQPASALFREGRIVVTEDDALNDQRLFGGILGAIATGVRRWFELAQTLGIGANSLRLALTAVIDAGWVAQRHDPIRAQRSTYELLEPLVRFNRLIIEPNEYLLNSGMAQRVWQDVKPLVASSILAPQLEQLAWDWPLLHTNAATLGGSASAVGPTSLPRAIRGEDGQAIQHLDLAAVETTVRGSKRLLAIGEVKALTTPVGINLLRRLDTAAASLTTRPPEGITVGEIRRRTVGRAGFTGELERAAEQRSDVELVNLHRLYHGS